MATLEDLQDLIASNAKAIQALTESQRQAAREAEQELTQIRASIRQLSEAHQQAFLRLEAAEQERQDLRQLAIGTAHEVQELRHSVEEIRRSNQELRQLNENAQNRLRLIESRLFGLDPGSP
jgi:chromosome segregation ATPase